MEAPGTYIARNVRTLTGEEEARRKIGEQNRVERRERVREKIESLKAKLNG